MSPSKDVVSSFFTEHKTEDLKTLCESILSKTNLTYNEKAFDTIAKNIITWEEIQNITTLEQIKNVTKNQKIIAKILEGFLNIAHESGAIQYYYPNNTTGITPASNSDDAKYYYYTPQYDPSIAKLHLGFLKETGDFLRLIHVSTQDTIPAHFIPGDTIWRRDRDIPDQEKEYIATQLQQLVNHIDNTFLFLRRRTAELNKTLNVITETKKKSLFAGL